MRRILTLFLNDKNRILRFCASHAEEIASTFVDLSKDKDMNVKLKNQFLLEYNINDERRKLRLIIRQELVHHFFFDMSLLHGPVLSHNEGSNAVLGVIDRSGSYSLLSFSLWSLSTKLNDEDFTKYIGSIAETVSEALCRTIPQIYVYGNIKRDDLYSLVDFYRKSPSRMESPQVIVPSTWVEYYGKDISEWSAPRGSFLKDVDLSGWKVTVQQVAVAFGDASVILPDGVKPSDPCWPKHWPIWDMKFRYQDWLDSDGKLHLKPPGFEAEWRKWQSDPHSYRPPLPPSF